MNGIWQRLSEGVVTEMINKFAAVVPQLTSALLVFFIGLLLSRLVRAVVRRLLSKVGIDRLGESLNDIELVQKTGMTIRLSAIISQTIYTMLMLIFTIAATDALGVEAITKLVSDIINYLPALFSAAIVFMLGLFVADMIKGVVVTALQSLGIPSAKMIGTVVFYFLFVTIAVSALAQAKINTEFIAANLTVVVGAFALAFALGYGFASRDLMSNYLAGLYQKNKVHVGDEVQIMGTRGKVVALDHSSMILQTHDRAILVPMSKLTTETIEIFYPDGQDENLIPDKF